MHNLFRLAVTIILIVSFVPSEVLSDNKLQDMADIVKHFSTARLCEHDCRPVILIRGKKLTLSYETNITTTDNTDALCKCMYNYMKKAIGDATSDCRVTKTEFAIVFNGKYSPNKKPSPPLTALASIGKELAPISLGENSFNKGNLVNISAIRRYEGLGFDEFDSRKK